MIKLRFVLIVLTSILLIACGMLSAEENKPDWEKRGQEVSAVDLDILLKAQKILHSEAVWNRKDDRKCPQTATTWSLFCALYKASIEVDGQYVHRRVSLQEVRFAIEKVTDGEEFAHRLMDFNNSRKFDEIHKVLTIAIAEVKFRLKANLVE